MSYKEDLDALKPEFERIVKQRESLTKVLGNIFKLKGILLAVHFDNSEGEVELKIPEDGDNSNRYAVIKEILTKMGYKETKPNNKRYAKDGKGDVEICSAISVIVRLGLEENNPSGLRYLRGREKLIDLIDSVPKGASFRDAMMKSKIATRINDSIFKLNDTGYAVFKSDTDWSFFQNIADIFKE